MSTTGEGPSYMPPMGGGSIQNLSVGNLNRANHWTPCQHYISEDVLAGLRPGGKMSVVRRFFCLFATFDLLFTSLMWLICLVLTGNFDFYDAFNSQIVHYHIETSLFDVVMAACVRFTALILFYALLYINHWIIVALTTAGTCAFLVAKVYFYNWAAASQPVMQVLLILSSFILCWAEAWFLDLRVVPQEKHAKDYFNVVTNFDESSPLLRKFFDSSRGDALSDTLYHSPHNSPDNSDDESPPSVKTITLSPEMVLQLRKKGEEILLSAVKMLDSDNWSSDSVTKDGDSIYSQKIPNGPKIFLLVGQIDASPESLFDIIFKRIEEHPSWNPTIKESKILQVVDNNTDITYQVSGDGNSLGVIKSRDFVLIRHWSQINDRLIISSASITSSCAPAVRDYIRGENGPSCWSIRQISADGNKSEFQWLVNTNVKGWVPQHIMDSIFSRVLVDYMVCLRKKVSSPY